MKIWNVVLLSFFIYCQSPSIVQKPSVQPKNQFPVPTVEAMQAIDLSTGTSNQKIRLSDESDWPFRIHIPKVIKGERMPLIIALHWAGGGATYQEYGQCLAEPGLSQLGGIVFTPSAANEQWWKENLSARIIRFIELAKEHWPIDPRKILITGYSNGGNGTWFFIQDQPTLFTAAIPMAASPQIFKKTSVPIYSIHGIEDELFNIKEYRRQVDLALSLGSQVKTVELANKSHFMACNYVEDLQKAANWVMEEIWAEND